MAARGLVKTFSCLAGLSLSCSARFSCLRETACFLSPFSGARWSTRDTIRNTRPRLASILMLIGAAMFASSVLLATRDVGQRGSIPEAAGATLRNPASILEPVTRGADAEMAPALAAVLQVIPDEVGYMEGGGTVGDLLTRPIPRQLWSAKPLSPRETVISHVWPREYRAGVANPEFSVLLYFYLDFALPGVIVGMACFGIMARVIYEYHRAHPRNSAVSLIYSLCLPIIVFGLRDSPVDTFVRAVFLVAPVIVILRYASIDGRPAAPRGL